MSATKGSRMNRLLSLGMGVAVAAVVAARGADVPAAESPSVRDAAREAARKASLVKREADKTAARQARELQRVDRNHDGRIDATEEEAARNSWYAEHGYAFDHPWEPQADANHDGRLSPEELFAFKRSLLDVNEDGRIAADDYRYFFRRARSQAQTAWERKHDADGDGFLDGHEIANLLRDRLLGLKGAARRPVECKFDRLFDANSDGWLSADEAIPLELAVGE